MNILEQSEWAEKRIRGQKEISLLYKICGTKMFAFFDIEA